MFGSLKDARLRARVHLVILVIEVLLPFGLYASLQAGLDGLSLGLVLILGLALLVLAVLP